MMRLVVLFAYLYTVQTFAQIPPLLVKERSLVIMNWPLEKSGEYMVRGDWEGAAVEVQKNFKLMGVDAVAYIHGNDWSASPASQETFRSYFRERQIKHLIQIGQNENDVFYLDILDFTSGKTLWSTTGGSLNQAILRLARAIKLSGHAVENYLPADYPEIVYDVPFSKWTATTNFPDQIKRLKIGIARPTDANNDVQLRSILSQYPFDYELIDYKDDEDALRQGYQIVMLSMNTSGESIRKLLNYKPGANETHYLSTVKADSSRTTLKTIPVDAFVHKFYFQQTANHEAYVGRDWDADTTWQKSLENFLNNLRIAFRMK
jgi:hypothetical protein